MLKTECFIKYNEKEIEKLFVAGYLIKAEIKNNLFFISLASVKGKENGKPVYEYTNNIAITDTKKIDYIKKLKRGTQLFCEINITSKESNGKVYKNNYLFNFDVGKEGKGEPIFSESVEISEEEI